MITNDQLEEFRREFEAITTLYREEFHVYTERDWRTYEQEWAFRIRRAAKEINKVIYEADCMIKRVVSRGRPSTVSSRQKALILLIKDIFQLSNRKMSNLFSLFSLLNGVDIGYKTIERSLRPYCKNDYTQYVYCYN